MAKRLKPWTEEFRFQISLAENVWDSKMPGKERIAFVLLDNVIEFMCKCYLKVAKRLVGTGAKKPIDPNKWEKISYRHPELIKAMRTHSSIPPVTLDSIEEYHRVRNDLYHTSQPMSVAPSFFKEELRNTVDTLYVLFGEKYQTIVMDLADLLDDRPQLENLVKIAGPENAVRVDYEGEWSLSQWVKVVIYGHAIKLGNNPTFQQILHSLQISHRTPPKQVLQQCLRNLRKSKQVTKTTTDTFSLNPKGRKLMEKNR